MGCGGSKNESQVKTDGGGHGKLPKKLALNETSWEDYLSCDRDISMYQKRHVVEMLKVRSEQKRQLEENVKHMEEELKRLDKDIKSRSSGHNGVAGSPGGDRLVKNFLMKQDRYDELAAYEKADHVACLNKKEILRKELSGTQQHVRELTHECELLQEDVDDLRELCETQDRMLDTWFDGDYGSKLENQLEDELEALELRMQKYEEVNFKWRQAQVMVEYACKQIGTAVKKWEEIMKLPMSAMEARYRLAEETRNNLIAAGQNLQGAHRYLPHIQFPYCTPEEVVMLNKATSYVFTDMQAKARQGHALDCYAAAHRRSGALLQWCNQTINISIGKHLKGMKEKAKKVRKELRRERANLIAALVKTKLGKTIEVSSADIDFDGDSASEYDVVNEDDKHRRSSGNSVTMRGSYSQLDYSSVSNAPSPLPLEELAPPPTKHQLFGPIDEKNHEQHMNHKNSGYADHNKAKAGQRRNRRLTMDQHEQHSNGPHQKSSSIHHQRQMNHVPNQVMDDELEYIDGHHMAKKFNKQIERF